MDLTIELLNETSADWAEMAVKNLDHFLIDHAACERKASATGVNFVVQYPDRSELIDPMLRFAREELLHYQQVCRILRERNLIQVPDMKDPYIQGLMSQIRTSREERFLDRLLTFGIVEARGTERFSKLAEALDEEPQLQNFYRDLATAEARHHELFVKSAQIYFKDSIIKTRLLDLLRYEAQLVTKLPLRATVH